MKLYQIWVDGEVFDCIELYPDEAEMLTNNGYEVYEIKKEVAA